MAIKSPLGGHFTPLVDILYPPRCPACGGAIARQDGLCSDCWGELEVPSHVNQSQDLGAVPVFAATFYNDTSRRLVLAYKHGGRIALARLLAQLIAARLPEHGDEPMRSVLVPVPLHRWRLWQRGFNQAALLAQELERMGKGHAELSALVRHKRTPNLGNLGRESRERALKGAIRLNPTYHSRLSGKHVMLVDDVLTSGATSRACIAALKDAGPASISVACFAQVDPDHRLV